MEPPSPVYLREHVEASLDEDIGEGDVTTRTVVDPNRRGQGRFRVKDEGILAGVPLVEAVFDRLAERMGEEGRTETVWRIRDGERVEPSQVVGTIEGPARLLLTGERVALNYLQQMSGVATATDRFVQIAREHGVEVYDTRKTVPHHRRLQKYAVRCGGGRNHRLDLSEAVMIKDNHKMLSGGLLAALEQCDRTVPIVVEIHDPSELEALGGFDIDVIMLDNMRPNTVQELMNRVPDGVPVEVSGGIYLSNLAEYCQTGVDRVSVGALTHSSPSLDISFELIRYD